MFEFTDIAQWLRQDRRSTRTCGSHVRNPCPFFFNFFLILIADASFLGPLSSCMFCFHSPATLFSQKLLYITTVRLYASHPLPVRPPLRAPTRPATDDARSVVASNSWVPGFLIARYCFPYPISGILEIKACMAGGHGGQLRREAGRLAPPSSHPLATAV
jgi:hypothetical protein